MASCLFCRIVQGDVPSTRVHEDERALAFLDIRPQAPIHIVVIPKIHLDRLADATDAHRDLLGHLMQVAAGVARDRGLAERGYRLVVNNGPDGGQTVDHLHLHLLGGRALGWPPG